MLEWKPKLVTLILALAIVAMLVSIIHVGSLSTDLTVYYWD